MKDDTERIVAARHMARAAVARKMAKEHGVGRLTGADVDAAIGNDAEAEAAAVEFFGELAQADHEQAWKMLNKFDGNHRALHASIQRIEPFPRGIQ